MKSSHMISMLAAPVDPGVVGAVPGGRWSWFRRLQVSGTSTWGPPEASCHLVSSDLRLLSVLSL